MSLYVIGDLHLSFTSNKPMDVFGKSWNNHVIKISDGFSRLNSDDVTVICGDISWGMGTDSCLDDFKFIDSLPGRKILLKGNHDYWWSTVAKTKRFFTENNINSIDILHNNSFVYEDISICGTRGWAEGELNQSVLPREIGRLRASLDSSESNEIYLFLHYPPCESFCEIIKEYNIRKCFYGHIHGDAIKYAFNGWKDGCEFKLVSADALAFNPLFIH